MKKLMLILVSLIVSVSYIHGYAEGIDVESSILSGKISMLEQLGIIGSFDDATYRPDDTVSRGEFAIYAAKLFGLSESATGYFSDIPDDADYAGYVGALAENGLIHGDGNEGYEPERDITFIEAVTVMLNGMGYEEACKIEGGFPNGYLKMASRAELGSAPNGAISRVRLAELFYDVMTANIMKFNGVSELGGLERKVMDKTVMEEYLGLVEIKGILTYDGITSTDGMKNGIVPQIVVGGTTIETDGILGKYLGYNVTVFAYDGKNGDGYRLGAIIPTPNKNKDVTISSEDIESVTNASVIRAMDGKSYKSYKMNRPSVIYNGLYISPYNDDMLKPKEGYIRLIDNNNDSCYDVIEVYNTIDDIISGVNTSSENIYLEEYGPLSIAEKTVTVYIDGKRKSIADIGIGNAVSAVVSDGDYIELWVSTQKNDGLLESINDECIVFDGHSYQPSEYFTTDGDGINVGKKYTAYVTWFGKLVKLSQTTKGDRYGWFMRLVYDDDIESPSNIRLKVLSDSGNVEYLSVGDRIRIQNQSLKAEIKSFSDYGLTDTAGNSIQQLVKYELTDEGKLANLYVYEDKTEDGIYEGVFSLDKSVRGLATRMYKYNVGINYHLGASTKIFYIPLESEMDIAEEEDYGTGTTGTFSSDITYNNFDIYDTRPDRSCGVMVIYRTIAAARVTDKLTDALMKRDLGVVVGTSTVNRVGDTKVNVRLLVSGKEISYDVSRLELANSTQDAWTYSSMTADKLSCGDIILFSKNEKNEICDFTILFRGDEADNKKFYERVPSNISIDETNDTKLTPLHTVFGEVYDINGKTYSINVTDPAGSRPDSGKLRYLSASGTSYVYLVDKKAKSYSVGSLSDISVGDVVFMRAYNYIPQQIVVFRN